MWNEVTLYKDYAIARLPSSLQKYIHIFENVFTVHIWIFLGRLIAYLFIEVFLVLAEFDLSKLEF